MDTDQLIADVLASFSAELDARVAAGEITQDQADRALAAAEEGLPRLVDGGLEHDKGEPPGTDRPPSDHRGDRPAHIGIEQLVDASTAGIPLEELSELLRAGGMVADIINATVAPIHDRIDAVVADGKLEGEKGDELKANAHDRITTFVNEAPPERSPVTD